MLLLAKVPFKRKKERKRNYSQKTLHVMKTIHTSPLLPLLKMKNIFLKACQQMFQYGIVKSPCF